MEHGAKPLSWFWNRVPTSAMGVGLGLAALLLGTLVYLTDRPPGSAVWIPEALHLGALSQAAGWPSVFGAWGGNLPSFAHAMAFSILSGLLFAGRRAAIRACLFWATTDAVFELLQHPALAQPTAALLREVFGTGPVALPLSTYFLNGRFDTLDLAASTLGATAAFAVLLALQSDRCLARTA